jgi:lysophospholipase L1-like esterase
MSNMTRRMLLGGVFATIASPALAGRDDDARPVVAHKHLRARYPQHSYRAVRRRWPVPPENEPNLAYQGHNKLLLAGPPSARRVVLMGDSITYNWEPMSRPFFKEYGLVDRGIGGETSAQMLLRFVPDVVELKPQAVHIMAGTNDLAALRRPYDGELTRRNIEAMATQAREAGIRVILASVTPATGFRWGKPAEDALKSLNGWIHDLCGRNGYTYCDYWPVLSGTSDRLKPGYSRDSVHPNPAAYAVMGPVLLAAIDEALKSPSRNATR